MGFFETIRDAGMSYDELVLERKKHMMSEAYQKRSHHLHSAAKKIVNAYLKMERIHEEGREKEAYKKLVADIETQQQDLGQISQGRRRQLLMHYGPREGKDTPKYRESLPENVRKIVQEKYGDPKDKDQDPAGGAEE